MEIKFHSTLSHDNVGQPQLAVYAIYPDGSKIFRSFYGWQATDEDYINRWKFSVIGDYNVTKDWPRGKKIERFFYPD